MLRIFVHVKDFSISLYLLILLYFFSSPYLLRFLSLSFNSSLYCSLPLSLSIFLFFFLFHSFSPSLSLSMSLSLSLLCGLDYLVFVLFLFLHLFISLFYLYIYLSISHYFSFSRVLCPSLYISLSHTKLIYYLSCF